MSRGMGKKHLPNYAERRRMEDIILANSEEREDGTRRWLNGFDFETVAKSVDQNFHAHHAKYVAKQLGFRFTAPVVAVEDPLEGRVAELERAMGERMGRATLLLAKIDSANKATVDIDMRLQETERRIARLEALFTDAELLKTEEGQ